jgi:predicted amidohydrolase YtcJ
VPPEGVIAVYNGELWGTVSGGATSLIRNIPPAPALTEEQNVAAVKFFQERMLGWGHTAINVNSGMAVADRMIVLEERGEWKIRANFMLGFSNPSNPTNFASNLATYKTNRDSFLERSDLVRLTTAKFFMDNVVEGGTAFLHKPYLNGMELRGDPDWRSAPRQDLDLLPGFFAQLRQEGIQIHVHSIGDAATFHTLNALEEAQELVPGKDTRNTITHLHIVSESDIPRFGELGVIASTQPFWHLKEPGWYDDMEVEFVGPERAWKGYPVKSFIDAGAIVTFSGDYNVTDPNYPFNAIEVAVTRNLYNGAAYRVAEITDIDDPTWLRNPLERITVAQAVEAYTINGAYQLFMENEIGSLVAGKWADMIVVDQDIMALSGNDLLKINQTNVLATIIAGEVVHGSIGSPIIACEHEFINDTGTGHPRTCTEDGYNDAACSRLGCDEIGKRILPALGHQNKLAAAKFINIAETSKNSNVWKLTFSVDERCTVCSEGGLNTLSVDLKGNNANQDGRVDLGNGYILVYDIKGNGSNIKTFNLIEK